MSKTSIDNTVIFSADTVFKYSPKRYVDFSIELEYCILKHLSQRSVSNIPTLVDYAFDPWSTDSVLEMSRIKGQTLYSVLENVPLAGHEAKALLMNLLYALNQLHEQGVTHGDLHGDNILMVPVQDQDNVWTVGQDTVTVPSFGLKPILIDFGFAHLGESPFRPDLSTTEAGAVTSLAANPTGDIVHLLQTLAFHPSLTPWLEPVLKRLSQPKYIAVDEKVTQALKGMVKRRRHPFLTAEMYNLIKCFPHDRIAEEEQLSTHLPLFLNFLHKERKTSPRDLCKKLKRWHFESMVSAGVRAGSTVVNHLVEKFTAEAMAIVHRHNSDLPFNTVLEAAAYFSDCFGKDEMT